MKKTRFFQYAHRYLAVALVGLMAFSCSKDPVLSGEAAILTFSFTALTPPVQGVVDGTNVTANVVYNQNVTALVPEITISPKASIQPASGIAQDFTSPVTYTVTAENGTTKAYTVTVTKAAPPVLVITPVWQQTLRTPGTPPSWFGPNTNREVAAFGDFVYAHANNDRIRVLNKTTGAEVDPTKFMSGTLITGGVVLANLMGIDTDDVGNIVGSTVGGASNGMFRVSKWANKDAQQTLVFETTVTARTGDNIHVRGNINGSAILYAPRAGTATIHKYIVTAGVANTTPQVIQLAGLPTNGLGGVPGVYALTAEANSNLILTGTGVATIAEYSQDGFRVGELPATLKTGPNADMFSALDAIAFTVNGRKVIAATATNYLAPGDSKTGTLFFIDYTDGWTTITDANIKSVKFTADGGVDANVNATGGVSVIVSGNTATVYALITNFGIGAYTVSVQ
jgi:hypothetical protein